MKLFFILTFLPWLPLAYADKTAPTVQNLLNSKTIELSRSDRIVADNVFNIIKLTEKGYVSKELLSKVISETSKSKHFQIFLPWLNSLQNISRMTQTSELLVHCRNYVTRQATLSLEKKLERISGNYCRERALEAIGRDIDKTKQLSDEASIFIQENLKHFLTKQNKKNFAYFIQTQSSRPEILKKLSQDVTNYSVSHGIVPSQDVLKDILINEQITKLIQDKGFNPLQHQNVFYAEYGKLIERGYRSLDTKNDQKPAEKKVRDHYKYLKNYLDLNEAHLPVGLCLSRLNDFAKAVYRNGFKDLSREIFRFIISKNLKDIHEDAQYFLLWTYFDTDDYKEALKVAESYNLVATAPTLSDPRLKFWIAHSLEVTGKKVNALALYENIISLNPLSYYAIMATKKLQTLESKSQLIDFYRSSVANSSNTLSFDPATLEQDYLSSLVRLRAWAKMDNQRMMDIELKRINLHSAPAAVSKISAEKQNTARSDLHLINARLIQESGNYLATFRYVYTVMDKKEILFDRNLLELLYPKPYFDQLTKVMKNTSIDPLVVLSLIRQESVFNPQARSPVGARGLMQLMPSTAKRLRRSVGVNQLANPAVNMELGVKYFTGLMKRYDGNLVYVLSAYNAGESRVERWRKLYWDADGSILKNIEAIPFLETRNYVKLIFRNIFFYKLIMEQQKELADTSAHNQIFDINLGFKH